MWVINFDLRISTIKQFEKEILEYDAVKGNSCNFNNKCYHQITHQNIIFDKQKEQKPNSNYDSYVRLNSAILKNNWKPIQ
jgi:hypothetical protein